MARQFNTLIVVLDIDETRLIQDTIKVSIESARSVRGSDDGGPRALACSDHWAGDSFF